MIRPAHFGFNPETAENNVFQQKYDGNRSMLQTRVLDEFDAFVNMLRTEKITVDVLHDDPSDQRLDAIFSNNWMSTHPDQTLITYPMFSPIRRRERDRAHIRHIVDHYQVLCHIALDFYEHEELYLEGTGSLIIDHEYGVVYGCRSVRTDEVPFVRFCSLMGYTPVLFDAVDRQGIPVYHTNVVMGIGRGYVLINRAAIPSDDWKKLAYYFDQTDKLIIDITHDQMASFLANSAFVFNADEESYIIMSDTAYQSVEDKQMNDLTKFGKIIHSDLSTIEKIGGGSAKCMITENYLNHR